MNVKVFLSSHWCLSQHFFGLHPSPVLENCNPDGKLKVYIIKGIYTLTFFFFISFIKKIHMLNTMARIKLLVAVSE